MKVLFTIGIILMYSLKGYGQNNLSESMKIDSLKKILAIEKEDTNKVNTLIQLEIIYFNQFTYNNNALQYANDALALAIKINFKRRIADCYYQIAAINVNMDNKYESIKNLYNALKLYEEAGKKLESANCLSSIGFSYFNHENYEEASDAYFKALRLLPEDGSDRNYTKGFCYIYLAKIFLIQKNFKQALVYDSIGLKISILINEKQMAANSYTCIGDIITQQISWNKSLNKTQLQSLKEAEKNYLKSLDNFRAVRDTGGMGDEFEAIAFVNIKLNNFLIAQKYVDSALLCAKSTQFKDNFEKSYLIQAQLDSAMGNYKKAFEVYKKYILYRDSIVNDKNAKQALQSSMQYEFDKKEAIVKAAQYKKDAEAKRIKNQQYFAIAGLGLLVLTVILIALIQFRNNKHKKRANILLQQQKQKVEVTLSELKSTQSQLIQSEKMASLGELTAGIAHEIQNPLNFVNNFSEINKELIGEMQQEMDKGNLADAKEISNDIKENSEKINHHGKRAGDIVKGMLQHSQKSTGVKEPTDINALADEFLRLSYQGLRVKDKAFNATMKTDFDKSIGKINIIPQDIGRVLLNLYNNAFYACTERSQSAVKERHASLHSSGQASSAGQSYEPTVSVTTKKSENSVIITVSDNGNGIPQKIVDKIFQPFFTTKPTGQGTGLGLSLSYDIVKAHAGEIKVMTKEGAETEFIIRLPV